jgi:itaconyl-CoA hydratase / mesaconyl-C4 CoA hydratase
MTDVVPTDWIGRVQETGDHLCPTLVKRLAATLGEPVPAPGEALPPLWHWAFFEAPVPERGLGDDGHPARGGFLPPAPGRQRMWAGSRIEFLAPLTVGSAATRVSTVKHVEEKHGRSGSLLFVTVRHECRQDGTLALREVQDIVYREPAPPRPGGGGALADGEWRETVVPTETLLFRFSAVTFNSHRIHYDWPYVTGTEGYPGLVVHGPLLAMVSVQAFRRAHPAARLHAFACRGVRPLFAPQPFEVGGRITARGRAELWAGDASGPAQTSEVEFQ